MLVGDNGPTTTTMSSQHSDDITALLNRSRDDPDAAAEVYRLVYRDLKRLAASQLGAGRDPTLSATALISEAYLKLVERTGKRWSDRRHFLRVAAKAMRQITIDYARARTRLKRGGAQRDATLDEGRAAADRKPEILLAMEDGLEQLRGEQSRWVSVVELRFFAGLSGEEAAEALGVSLSSVNRDWAHARAWLKRFLTS